MSSAWTEAFQAVQRDGNFRALNSLLEAEEGASSDVNASVEWEGSFLTPLFIAALLRLDDHVTQLIAKGASLDTVCLWDNLLCGPLHAACLSGDVGLVSLLLDAKASAAAAIAETCAVTVAPAPETGRSRGSKTPPPNLRHGLTKCSALHVLLARDVFDAELYTLLINRGGRLSAPCVLASGKEASGLALPRLLGNAHAVESQIDLIFGEEIKQAIESPNAAIAVNSLLEVGSFLRGGGRIEEVGYSFFRDVNSRFPAILGEDGPQPVTALLYAAFIGSAGAARLLLYAGSDSTIPARKVLPYSFAHTIILNAQPCHFAVAHGHVTLLEQMVEFGISASSTCSGNVVHTSTAVVKEVWTELSWIHIAVIAGLSTIIDALLRCGCDINAVAYRKNLDSGEVLDLAPMHLAVLHGDVAMTTKLMDVGAVITERISATAKDSEKVCEMFGGPPVIGLEDWLTAILSGEEALRSLILRRTDLSRALDWPESGASTLLERHLLISPDMIGRLVKTLEEVPTALQSIRPVHLACLLQQPWALDVLAKVGASVADSPPCWEVPRKDKPSVRPEGQHHEKDYPEGSLEAFPLDAVFLCARVGGLNMLELLCSDERFKLSAQREVALAPDLTPSFYPRQLPHGGPEDRSVTWAWRRLSPLHYAILNRRVDVAVLLVRLGADMLHKCDHVAVQPRQEHYSITDQCYKDLTPLHLCALLGNSTAAYALLSEAGTEAHFTAIERTRPRKQELLSATCTQAWVSVEPTTGEDAWLWKDLTPLHVAILNKNFELAELLTEASSPETLGQLCFRQDLEQGCEKSISALLMAYEQDLKSLHRKIARKFPTC